MPDPTPRPSPNRPAQNREPNYVEQLKELADRGDFGGLIEQFTGDQRLQTYTEDKVKLFREAIDTHGKKGGAGLAIAVLEHALRFDAEFLLRAQTIVRRKLVEDDKRGVALFNGVSDDVAKTDLPRLVGIEDRIMALARTIATLRHVQALAEAPPASRSRRVGQATGRIVHLHETVPDVDREREVASG